jgi:hypothetical protein
MDILKHPWRPDKSKQIVVSITEDESMQIIILDPITCKTKKKKRIIKRHEKQERNQGDRLVCSQYFTYEDPVTKFITGA